MANVLGVLLSLTVGTFRGARGVNPCDGRHQGQAIYIVCLDGPNV